MVPPTHAFAFPIRKRMFLPEHIRQGGCWREKARVWEPQKGGCGCRNDATKMHRENGNLIAVKWTEGKMVAAITRQKGKMERGREAVMDAIIEAADSIRL